MRRALHTATALLVVLASNAGSCESTTGGGVPCWADTHGLYAAHGRVFEKVTFRCDPAPRAFRGVVVVQRQQPDGKWRGRQSRPPVEDIPDAEGYRDLYGGTPCQPGRWRTAWRVSGVDAQGGTFKSEWDSDFGSTRLTEADCREGSG